MAMTAQEIILRARARAAGIDVDAEITRINDLDAAGLCRECGVAPRQIGVFCAACHAQMARATEEERVRQEREEQREREAAGLAAAAEAGSKRGITVGSTVRRKVGGVTGTVIALYQVCGHPLRYHIGRARLACQYKPHAEVGIQWHLTKSWQVMDRKVTHMPLSRVVLVESEAAS